MQFELYGPLWIYLTMCIEFLIVGHFQKMYNSAADVEALGLGGLMRSETESEERAN